MDLNQEQLEKNAYAYLSNQSVSYLSDPQIKENYPDQLPEMMKGFDRSESKIGELFFSKNNILILQRQICLTIFRQLNTKIPYQQEESLLIIMRHVYITYARHLDCQYKEQIIELNSKVLEIVIPSIIENIKLHNEYIRKIDNSVQLLEPPVNVTSRKTLPSVTTKFFNYNY
jgi:hypothetical protein